MKVSRASSAPRMQRVYTPRVKDGRMSNENPEVHYFNKTGTRFSNANPHYHYNPENSPAKRRIYPKEANHDVEQFVEQKLNLEPPKNEKEGNKNVQQPRAAPKNTQKTIQGRKLQYPANQRPVGNNQNRPQSVQLQRSSSVSSTSKHFVDTSVKSSAIKEKKMEFDEKFKVAFGYLLENNEAYLKQIRRAGIQKARPKDETFKIKRPSIHSTYRQEYASKDTPYAQHMHPFAETVANSFGPEKVCGNSTSNRFHAGRQGPRADLAEWPDHYKLQGPLYGVSNYANKYPNHGTHQKMVPVATFNEHPMGFPHKADSTYRSHHKGEMVKKADLATWNNLHPYGNDFDPNRGTTYGKMHNSKEKAPIQNWPMYQPRPIVTDGKFVSEYQGRFINSAEHELNEANQDHQRGR